MLNNFFSNCFNTSVPPLMVNDRDLYATTSSDCPLELLCTEDEILELLLSLDTTKANVTFHDKTKHNALTTDFELRSPLPTTTFELLLLQI